MATDLEKQAWLTGSLILVVVLILRVCCGCAASSEMKSLSDNYTAMRTDLTTHMQMASRIEGDVAGIKTAITQSVSAGGDIRYSDIWLTLVFGAVVMVYVVANEFREWRRRRNGTKR